MNKGIKFLVVAAIAAGVALSSQAANVSVGWAANDVTGVSLAGGTTAVPSGNFMMVGTFTNAFSGFGVGNSLAGFVQFATGTMGQNSVAGFFDINSVAPELVPAHQQIYVVAFNAVTQGAATQGGIWTYNLWGKPGIPASTDIPNSTAFDLEEMLNNFSTINPTLKAGAQIVFGQAPIHSTDFGGSTYLPLQNIPEPSTVMLVGLGMIGMVGLIRRRRQS